MSVDSVNVRKITECLEIDYPSSSSHPYGNRSFGGGMAELKCISVLVVDQSLEHRGIIANAAFVIGLTAGRELPDETFGVDVTDGDSIEHRYLTCIGHVVRKAGQSKLRTLRATLFGNPEVTVVDYPEDAGVVDYSAYADVILSHSGDEIRYRAIHFFGPELILSPLTKNLSRLE